MNELVRRPAVSGAVVWPDRKLAAIERGAVRAVRQVQAEQVVQEARVEAMTAIANRALYGAALLSETAGQLSARFPMAEGDLSLVKQAALVRLAGLVAEGI